MPEEKEPNLTSADRYCIIRQVINNRNISKSEIHTAAGITNPRSQRGTILKPDLVGKYPDGRYVIVEVKFKFDFPSDKNHLRSDPEKAAIGQILKYASAYRKCYPSSKKPLLFIVSIDFSKDVDAVCQFLHSQGIDLEHIAIENILHK